MDVKKWRFYRIISAGSRNRKRELSGEIKGIAIVLISDLPRIEVFWWKRFHIFLINNFMFSFCFISRFENSLAHRMWSELIVAKLEIEILKVRFSCKIINLISLSSTKVSLSFDLEKAKLTDKKCSPPTNIVPPRNPLDHPLKQIHLRTERIIIDYGPVPRLNNVRKLLMLFTCQTWIVVSCWTWKKIFFRRHKDGKKDFMKLKFQLSTGLSFFFSSPLHAKTKHFSTVVASSIF